MTNRNREYLQVRRSWRPVSMAMVAIFIIGCYAPPELEERVYTYPSARMADIVDDYHGTLVTDPYRWLEDPDAPETKEWVEAENGLTFSYLSAIEVRDTIEGRLTQLWNYPRYSLPRKEGERYFYWKNDGLQNQSVLYVQETLDGESRVLIDPNQLSEDGTVEVSTTAYSEDGTLLAYGLSGGGSDWQKVKILDVSTGEDSPDLLRWCKFTSIAWAHDNTGFYYDRFPEEDTVPEEDRNNYNRVYWHELGAPQSEDTLVYERPDNKELGFSSEITEDGRYHVLHVWHGTDRKNRVYYRELGGTGSFVRLLDEADAGYFFVDNDRSVFYFQTDLAAPRGRIIAIDTENAGRDQWTEIVPEQPDVLSYVRMINNQFVVAYMRNAHHQLRIFNVDGTAAGDIELPTLGSVNGISGEREDTEMFISFTSFLYPTTAFRYDFKTSQLSVYRQPEISFDRSNYETKQVFYTSGDGTQVPMFLTHRKGLELDGNNPTLLYGYGGFKISLTPSFSISRLVWLENGGVFALANLRGGGEFGEQWHQAGMLSKKQNVFDDFISAAQWLIEQGYTSTPRLAITGGSNGGLLVAACLVQRPDLFGAVVCRVPVIDMLRYHRFTVGRYWTGEYGNAEKDPEHFKFLYEYSPLNNVKKGITYPPTLVTSADTDDRVVPSHAKKFVATLQAADKGENPILIRVETKAGHGHGKPTTKIIEEWGDIYAFLFNTLGVESLAD